MNSAKNAMLATSMLALAARTVLAEALSPVEHDRVMHYPDTDSAVFELPEGAFDTLEKLGAVKRVDVVDTATVLAASAEAPSGPVVTFADAVDMAAMDGETLIDAKVVLGQLDEALVKSDALASELTASRLRVAALEAALNKHAELGTELSASQERVLELEALLAATTEEGATSATALAAATSVDTGSADAAAQATRPAAKSAKAARG